MITDERRRIGGRGAADIRKITCEVGLLPRVHGSALFTRGETQALVATTLGTAEDEQRVEHAHRHELQAVHAALQLPAVLRRRGEVPPRPGPARDRPRRARRARAAPRDARPRTSSRTRSASSPTSWSRTARRRWPRSAAAASRSWTRACRSRRRSPASRWGSSRRARRSPSSPTSSATRTTSATWTSRSAAPTTGITSIQMDIKIGGVTREILERALEQAADGPQAHPRRDAEGAPAARARRSAPTRRASRPSRSGRSASRTSSAPAAR